MKNLFILSVVVAYQSGDYELFTYLITVNK